MSPPHRQSVAQISAELGIHVVTPYNWRKTWRLPGEVLPASEKDPEGWGANDKFTVILGTADINTTEFSAYCREWGPHQEQVERWRQASQDANEKPVLTLKEQKELERLRAQDQPAGDQTPQIGAAPQGEGPGGGRSVADHLKKEPGLLGRGRGRMTTPDGRPCRSLMRAWLMVPVPMSWRCCWVWGLRRYSAGADSLQRVMVAVWSAAKAATAK